jgi:hypothetical protein
MNRDQLVARIRKHGGMFYSSLVGVEAWPDVRLRLELNSAHWIATPSLEPAGWSVVATMRPTDDAMDFPAEMAATMVEALLTFMDVPGVETGGPVLIDEIWAHEGETGKANGPGGGE